MESVLGAQSSFYSRPINYVRASERPGWLDLGIKVDLGLMSEKSLS